MLVALELKISNPHKQKKTISQRNTGHICRAYNSFADSNLWKNFFMSISECIPDPDTVKITTRLRLSGSRSKESLAAND